MPFPKGTPTSWGWEDIAPEDMAAVEVGDLKAPTKALDMASQKVTNLPAPTSGSEPATKDFVESLLQGLDWQQSILGELDTPPGSPITGDRYLVIATATGDWVGHEDDIAEWDGSAWAFTTPNDGFAVWNEATNVQKVYNGTAWVLFGSTVNHENITGVTSDQHHPQAHTLGSHSTKGHSELTDVTPDQHHPQAHALGSHSSKAHSELTDVTPDQHHVKTGDYEVFPLTEEVTAVPVAAAGNVGRIMRERANAGQVTTIKMCVLNSSDVYEWVQLGIST